MIQDGGTKRERHHVVTAAWGGCARCTVGDKCADVRIVRFCAKVNDDDDINDNNDDGYDDNGDGNINNNNDWLIMIKY